MQNSRSPTGQVSGSYDQSSWSGHITTISNKRKQSVVYMHAWTYISDP